MPRSPDNVVLPVEGRYVDEILRRQHSISVASREDHVFRRVVEVDPISHGCLDINSDDDVGVTAKAWDLSSQLVGRRREVNVLASALRAAPAT